MNQESNSQTDNKQDEPKGLIETFTAHRVASNLLMCMMILLGVWGIKKLNTQLFPTFEFDWVTVTVVWSGASPEDVEQAITIPIEQELKTLPGVRRLIARSQNNTSLFFIEVDDSYDLGIVLDDVKQRVAGIRNLPEQAEKPIIKTITRYSPIANIIISGNGSLEELRPIAYQLEQSLLSRGIGKIEINGLPEEELAIEIPSSTLHELGMTLSQISDRIRQYSRDLPAGTLGRKDGATQIRSLGQQRDERGFQNLPIITEESGRLIHLGDIANVTQRAKANQPFMTYEGKPAIELAVQRTETDDAIASAEIMQQWIKDIEPTLPQGVTLRVYYETWKNLQDRIDTLLNNGLSGLFLVICALFLFLNVRVAWWVMVGIPISFLATLGILYLIGGSINMISLFGLILALGIIVDDAIVVGEDTASHQQDGEGAYQAAVGGAKRMLAPVLASSLTTIAAFLPLMMLSGVMGKIVFDIPMVIICVIIASLVECFLILPGHLHHSLKNKTPKKSRLRQYLDDRFEHFQNVTFRRWVTKSIEHRSTVAAAALGAFIISIGIIKSGWLPFTFFPSVDGNQIRATVKFTAGTNAQKVDTFLLHLEDTLEETNQQYGGAVVTTVLSYHRIFAGFSSLGGSRSSQGEEKGTLIVEVYTGNDRTFSNDEFIAQWREKIQLPAGVDTFMIAQPEAGPPGKPIEVKLTGADSKTLKTAALEIQEQLKTYSGISNVEDDMPYGNPQLIYALTPTAKALGLTLSSVSSQLRAAFDGHLVQFFNAKNNEVEVKVMLPEIERDHLHTLQNFPILTPQGETLPLSNMVSFESQKGVSLLRRTNGQLAIKVSANLDSTAGNANVIIADLKKTVFKLVEEDYGITISYEGKLKNQRNNFADMQMGSIIALVLIYLILAWVFSSYSWPMAVMAAIFLGLIGAVLGHIIMLPFGVQFSLFSLMGLFGLSGIIVNDSIVLVSFYRQKIENGAHHIDAIIDACCLRLRAVLLTSITTIVGIAPILFETSLQAQFLKPMVVSLAFGLAVGTVLILIVVPSMLVLIEERKAGIKNAFNALINQLYPKPLYQAFAHLWNWSPSTDSTQNQVSSKLDGTLFWVMFCFGYLWLQTLDAASSQVSYFFTHSITLYSFLCAIIYSALSIAGAYITRLVLLRSYRVKKLILSYLSVGAILLLSLYLPLFLSDQLPSIANFHQLVGQDYWQTLSTHYSELYRFATFSLFLVPYFLYSQQVRQAFTAQKS